MENPFTTTFGIEPTNYIKRNKESDQIINEFSSSSPSNYVYIITGIRGSGKTVLLSSIANHFMKEDDWIVVDPGPKDNIIENVASEIYETGKVKKLFLKNEFSFSFHGLTFSIEGDEPVSTSITLLKKMLSYLKKKKKKVLITIDEVDNSQQMKYFIQAYQSLLRLNYPVMLLMTGLYDNVSKLQEDKSLTFLYRAPKIYLEPLNINSIALNYQKYINVDYDNSLELAKLTKGYAYAYQVLGYLLCKNKTKNINDVIVDYDQYLADYVYDKLFSELSEKEQRIVLSFKGNDKIKTSDLCEATNLDIKTLSAYRDRLLKKGIVTSPTYGYLEFALPRFYEYLKSK